MMDKSELEEKEDAELREALRRVRWPITHGYVTIRVKDSKPTVAKIERTVIL